MESAMIATVDDTGLSARIEQLRYAFIGMGREGDARVVVENESRLFAKDVMIKAPPPGPNSRAKTMGEHAVAADLMKIFTPVNEELLNMVGSAHGVANVDAYWMGADGHAVHAQWDRIDGTGDGMAAFHKANRNRHGRTRNLKSKNGGRGSVWYAPYVVTFSDFQAYVKKVHARVGRRKAGWAKSLIALGGTAQAWITRHLGSAPGSFRNDLSDTYSPHVMIGNSSPGIMDDIHEVKSSLKWRERSIARKIKLILSGYSRDVASRMKISRKEKRTTGGLEDFAASGAGYER